MATHKVPYTAAQIDTSIGTLLSQGFCTCSTAESSLAKTANLTGYVLAKGGVVAVQFLNAVPASSTLSINSQPVRQIYYQGNAIREGIINAGDTATFIYNGTSYNLMFIDGGGGE